MFSVVINFAAIVLIVLGKEIIDVLFLSVLREVSLHDLYGDSVELHITDISRDALEELVAALRLEISNHAGFASSAVVFLVPSEEPVQCLHYVHGQFGVLSAVLERLQVELHDIPVKQVLQHLLIGDLGGQDGQEEGALPEDLQVAELEGRVHHSKDLVQRPVQEEHVVF